MRQSVVGIIVSIVILFVSIIVLPTYFIGVINWRSDMNECQTAARNFVDMVIDNGSITEKAMTDLNLSIASCHGAFTYEYFREEKIVNPTASNGDYKATWVHVEVDENTKWRTGDICTIVIKQRSASLFQRLSSVLLGTSFNNIEIRLSGMVR